SVQGTMRNWQTPTPWLVGGAFLLLGGQTLAAPPGGYDAPSYVNYKRPKPERRAGFHVGVQAGWGLGVAQAYPNEAAKIGDPTFEQSTGAGLGNEFSLWLGAALRDWLTFGFGLSIESVRGNGLMGTNVGPIFKVETFPFY